MEYKIEIYAPEDSIKPIHKVLSEIGAGKLGNYDSIMSITKISGYWRPLEGSNPYNGEISKLCYGSEVRLDMRCSENLVKLAVKTIKENHPYEKPMINIIPLFNDKFE
ncbi:cation tolerance protein CutA [bacterium K02(2017)]|nr:cation tolerance protein CutA [bacterium K02(2017)]